MYIVAALLFPAALPGKTNEVTRERSASRGRITLEIYLEKRDGQQMRLRDTLQRLH